MEQLSKSVSAAIDSSKPQLKPYSEPSPDPVPNNDVPPAKPASILSSRSAVGKVARRIRSINDLLPSSIRAQTSKFHSFSRQHEDEPTTNSNRALSFFRRGTNGTSLIASTPQSPVSDDLVLSPVPQRVQPHLPTHIENGAGLNDHNTIKTLVSPPRHLKPYFKPVAERKEFHNNAMCPRHGRKLVTRRKGTNPTTGGLEKSISGSYVPTGRKIRHQVDALNPWITFEACLTKQEGTTVSPEICPDCVAEHDIKKRELGAPHASISPCVSPDPSPCPSPHLKRSSTGHTTLRPSSIITEPGTPPNIEDNEPNSLIGTSNDHDKVFLPGTAVSGMSLDDVGSIIAADLGNMLDAIIIEHSGTLDKVITNIRDGVAGPERMHKLSRDLSQVSQAVADISKHELQRPVAFVRQPGARGRHSMILDMDPVQLRQRTRSVPELLGFIDAAAEDLGLDLPGSRSGSDEHGLRSRRPRLRAGPTRRPSRRLLHIPGGLDPILVTPAGSALPTPDASGLSSSNGTGFPLISSSSSSRRAPVPSEIVHIRDFAPASNSDPAPPPYEVAREFAPASASNPTTTSSGAVHTRDFVPASASDPNPPPGEMSHTRGSVLHPPTNSRPPSLHPRRPSYLSRSSSRQPRPPLRQSRSPSRERIHPKIQPAIVHYLDSLPPTPEASSRIPSSKHALDTPQVAGFGAPRQYTSTAPYQANIGGTKVSAVKPSDVAKIQKAERTLEQSWIRRAQRASSSRERTQRAERRRWTEIGDGHAI